MSNDNLSENMKSEVRTSHAEWEVGMRVYLERIIDEHDRLYDARFKASEIAVNAALAAQEKAVNAAFLASEKAIVKAEDAQKDYNERSNEFRGQLDDQAKMLMPRIETMGLFKGVEDKFITISKDYNDKFESARIANEKVFDATTKALVSLSESRSESAGRGVGIGTAWGVAIALIGIVIALSRFIK